MLHILFLNFATLAPALLITLRLRIRPLALAPLTLVAIHILIIQTFTGSLGLAALLTLPAFHTLASFLLIASALYFHLNRQSLARELNHYRDRYRRTLIAVGPTYVYATYAVILGATTYLIVVGYLVGPYLADVTTYHLAPPTDWIADGQITTRHWLDPRSYWPQGHSLLTLFYMLPLQSPRTAIFAEIHWLALTWTVVWAIARSLRASPRAAAFAVMLTLPTPVIIAQATSGLNSLAISTLTLAALITLTQKRFRQTHAFLGPSFIAIALGVKGTMAPLALPLIILWAIRSALNFRHIFAAPPNVARACILVFAIAIITGSSWYVRNTLLFDNPFYPVPFKLSGQTVLPGAPLTDAHHGAFGLDYFKGNLSDLLLEKFWDSRQPSSGSTEHGSAFGPLAIALGLPAIFAIFGATPRSRFFLLMTLILFLTLCAAVDRHYTNSRFFIFVPIVAIAAIAAATERIRPPRARLAWTLLLIATSAWSLQVAARLTIPKAARQIFTTDSIRPILPHEILNDIPVMYTLGSLQKLPPDNHTLAIVSLGHQGYSGAMHSKTGRRKLIYLPSKSQLPQDRILPTQDTITQWRQQDVHYILLLAERKNLPELHPKMLALGLIPLAESLYEIP